MMTESEDEDIEWTADLDVHLLFAMVGIKPVGIHRSFHMLHIWRKFTSSINRNVSPRAIWKRLETMFDLSTLDEAEGLQFPNEFEEFSLPDDEFGELIAAKRKETVNNPEAVTNVDESSSDVVQGPDRETEDIDTENIQETLEISDDSTKKKKLTKKKEKNSENIQETLEISDDSTKKKKLTKKKEKNSENIQETLEISDDSTKKKKLTRKKEKTSEDIQETLEISDDSAKKKKLTKKKEKTSEDSVKVSESPKNKRQKRETESSDNGVDDDLRDESENFKTEDSDRESVVKSRTPASKDPKIRKHVKNMKKVEVEEAKLDLSLETSGSTEGVLNIEKEVVPSEDKKRKSSPMKSKVSKIRSKVSSEKSEEGTDLEGCEEDTRLTKLDVGESESLRSIGKGKVSNTETSVVESKKRKRKQEEESEKKSVKDTESSSSSKQGVKVQRDTKPTASSHKNGRGKDEVQAGEESKIDSDDEVFAKRISMKSNVDEDEDSDNRKSHQRANKKESKRDNIVSVEMESNKKPRRGFLKTLLPVSSLKSETSESRRLSRGDEASKTSSDDMEATNEKIPKKDLILKSESKKAERTFIRSKVKADASSAQAEPEASQGSTLSTKKGRMKDSLMSESSSNKRKLHSTSSSKRGGKTVPSTAGSPPKRRQVIQD